ncbi:hypothetical protein A0H81_09288 [Grifola frondosa]|uniref:Zn(2)-C6 fungal-type domain-containing protein n=1 Tax=Grifola frondosa TaxID=5627 RepID=A0A1C7M1F3_GRIFR|nr:hypothetical protein A0H81_09288 [Grifola frondosa]
MRRIRYSDLQSFALVLDVPSSTLRSGRPSPFFVYPTIFIMAEKREPNPSPGPTTLQRGKACLRCRKRKMRCDGAKPACLQCVRAKKTEACEYDDGKGKTRTQLMREHIARLEMRVKELENPEQSAPSMTLFDPHALSPYYSESSSSSSYDSPGKLSLSTSASPVPFPLDMDPSWEAQWSSMSEFPPPGQVNGSYANAEDPPVELAQMLLEIFLPHRHQCGLELHVGRLRDSLSLPSSEQHHPVLMNSIYLWACYLSRPGSLSDNEPLYLSRALAAVSDALHYPTKAIDLIQALCLLSIYYMSNGRLFEGSYYCAMAASLSIQCRLHQIGSDEMAPSPIVNDWDVIFQLDPPKDGIERGERILTFWQVYNLDRCWSVVLQRPATLPDSDHPWSSISTPWPQRMEEYESGDLDAGRGSPTIRGFFVQQPKRQLSVASPHRPCASRPLRSSKGRIAYPPAGVRDPSLRTCFPRISARSSIPSYASPRRWSRCTNLAHASMIRLHAPFMRDDPVSREKCLRAARSLILVTKHITELDFAFLDPLIGPCWVSAAKVLEFELVRLQTAWPPLNSMEVRGELEALLYVMTKLSIRFPLLVYQSAKLQNCLDGK